MKIFKTEGKNMNEQKQVSNQQTQPVQTQEPVKKKKGKIKGSLKRTDRKFIKKEE